MKNARLRKTARNQTQKVGIIIPTYNEASNIRPLLDKIFIEAKSKKNSGKNKSEIHVLVVDDNSPDGTAKIVKNYSKKNKKVHLLIRNKKEGLGAAYIHGMKHIQKILRPKIIFEMDADGQHNPKDILRMIKEINKGNDFVIGSRYVKGGKTPNAWGIHRKLISFTARKTVSLGLGLGSIRDTSGGFRAIRTSIFKKVNLDDLKVSGYAFQAALLEAVVRNKFKVAEIPITFGIRNDGESKMTISDAMEGWKLIFYIRSNQVKKFFNNISKPLNN